MLISIRLESLVCNTIESQRSVVYKGLRIRSNRCSEVRFRDVAVMGMEVRVAKFVRELLKSTRKRKQ